MRMWMRESTMRHGPGHNPKIGHRDPRCTSHTDKAAARHMIRAMGLEAARSSGWVSTRRRNVG